MPRKTLALISGLVLVTVVLFVIALKTNNTKPTTQVSVAPTAAPAIEPVSTIAPAHAILGFTSTVVPVAAGRQGVAEVVLDTREHAVTAVQLEIKYDPTVIGSVKVVPGTLFPSPPVVLIDKNDPETGTYTFAAGIQPSQATLTGAGPVAKITFIARKAGATSIELKPESIVTARGVATSVLSEARGTTIEIK